MTILLATAVLVLVGCREKEIKKQVVIDKDYREAYTWIQQTPYWVGDYLFWQETIMTEPARYWLVLEVTYVDGTMGTKKQTVPKETWEKAEIGKEWKW